MLFDHDLNGAHLPEKSLCLTFDDGPGPHTRELAYYLFENNIPATFFVIGEAAASQRALLRQLRDWGHAIGNHTWSHQGLVNLAMAGGDVVREVARVDAVIRPVASSPVLLRPPYGSWRPQSASGIPNGQTASLVAQLLRESKRFDNYVGPIMWDIVGEDWKYWEQGRSVQQCLHRHIDEIDRVGRGIVLLHDSSDELRLRAGNRTTELVMLLVPILRSKNYRFLSLDAAVSDCLTPGAR